MLSKPVDSVRTLGVSKGNAGWFALAVFSIQLIRFYAVVPREALTCSEVGHHHSTGDIANVVEHSGEDLLLLGDVHQNYFQHCKDTLNGMCLTPAQPLGLPALAADQFASPGRQNAFIDLGFPIDSALPPPFQPPRNLA